MDAREQIDALIAGLTDWRGSTLTNVRRVIHEAAPDILEEWKWLGSPVFSHNGIVCVAKPLKDKVKLTFDQGASLPDPGKLFNNGLDGKRWRAIDLYQNDAIDEAALKALVRAAVEHNAARGKAAARKKAGA